MERIILSIIFFVSYTASFSQNWQLIWEDNFDGTELDSTKWIQEYGTGAQYNMWGWGNGELQHYQSQNTTLSNGIAKIEVKEEPAGIIETYWNTTSYYSSSKISTKEYLTLDMVKWRLELKLLMVKVFGLHFGCCQLEEVGLVMEK